MYVAVTQDIEVTVEPEYVADRSEPEEDRYFWAYHVTVANRSGMTVQLRARYWRITDSTGRVEEVRGPGVVGEQPILNPGDSFSYTSGCPLKTPSGIMMGEYEMVDADGQPFAVEIPAFSLDLPGQARSIN